MQEPNYGGLYDKTFLKDVFIFIVVLGLIIFGLSVVIKQFKPIPNFCDYDSCSQQSSGWKYAGSSCFDRQNPECIDFLRLWDVCQNHKKYVGTC